MTPGATDGDAKTGESKIGDLRERAKRRLGKTRQAVANMTPDEVQELVYDLQVHQIELEMQNEALVCAQAETELARQKYADLYADAPAGYLTIGANGTIAEANRVAADMLGRPRERLLGQVFMQFLTPDCQDTFYIHKRTVLRSGERHSCHVEIRANTPVHLHVHSQKIDGQTGCFNMVMSDITLMKKLEARLTQLHAAAEAANTAKSQFLANMSHEIRTPLNAIIGIGHLLGKATLGGRHDELVGVLNTSAEGLHTLVTELLDFSRVESGKIDLESQPFSLRLVADDVVRMLQITAAEKNLAIRLDYDAGVPDDFIGDRYRLRQVMINLVSNAIKFTEAGSVTLRVTGAPSVDARMALDIEVADTGIGIAPDKLGSIFDTFTQADASTTRRFGGTGLGLSIARLLIEHMDGDIVVSSEVGVGSTFRIHLPLPLAHAADKTPGDAAQIPSPAPRLPQVLVVDDYAPNLMIMTTYLDDLGYAYDVCTDGRQAVDQFNKKPYALILMDVQMPVMDGLEATAEIRRLEKAQGLGRRPIIAVTAHIRPADRQQCHDAGMDGYMPKPFSPEDLQAQLAKYAQV